MHQRDEDALANAILETVRLPLLALDGDLRVETANDAFLKQFQVSRDDTLGHLIYDVGNGQWDTPELRQLLENVLPEQRSFDDYEVQHTFEDIGRRVMVLNGRRLDHQDLILLAIRDVTDARESAAQLRQVADAAQIGVFENDRRNGTLYWSAELRDIFGYPRDKPPAKDPVPDFIHPDDRLALLEKYQSIQNPQRDGTFVHEHRIVRPDGEVRWVHMQGQVEFSVDDDDRRPVYIQGVVLDVTDRKRAEEKLRENKAQQDFLLRLTDALRPVQSEGEIVGEACRQIGEQLDTDRAYFVRIDEEEGIAHVEKDFVRGESPSLAGKHRIQDFAWSMKILRRGDCHVVADTQTSDLVPAADRPSCAALEIIACMGAPLIKNGRVVGALCVAAPRPREWKPSEVELLKEVGERVWASVERARAEAALRESEARHKALFNSVDEGVCLFERLPGRCGQRRDYRYLAMNPTMQEMFGVPDLTGRSMRDNASDEAEQWYDDYDRVLDTGEPIRIERESRTRGLMLSMFVSRVESGETPYLLCVIQDITARKRAEEALRESEERKAFLLCLADAIRPLTDPVLVMGAASEAVGEHLGVDQVAYAEIEMGTGTAIVRRDWRSGAATSLVGRHQLSRFGTFADDLARGESVVIDDIAEDPRTSSAEARNAFARADIVAMLEVPLVKDDKLHALLSVSCRQPRHWTGHDLAIVREAAERTWAAVEQSRAEERRDFLMKEVNHRSKNILSLVLAIANSSTGGDQADFMATFQRRVMALSASQDLLVQGQWKGVCLEDLVHAQLDHFERLGTRRVRLNGPPMRISSKTSETLSMVLHELSTNAGKYGALSVPDGRVELEWGIEDDPERGRRLRMRWQEVGGPIVEPPVRKGFGSQVIQDMAEGNLWGDVKLDYAPSGLVWELDAPADHCLESTTSVGKTPAEKRQSSVKEQNRLGRILLVEDETMIAMELTAALQKAGHDVVGPARSVSGALTLLEGGSCDAAVLDINLGKETSAPIAEFLQRRQIPFVAVTGYNRSQLPEVMEQAPLLTKPLRIEALLATLTDCLVEAR